MHDFTENTLEIPTISQFGDKYSSKYRTHVYTVHNVSMISLPLKEVEDDSNHKTDDRDSTTNIGHHLKSKFISSGLILQKSKYICMKLGHALH